MLVERIGGGVFGAATHIPAASYWLSSTHGSQPTNQPIAGSKVSTMSRRIEPRAAECDIDYSTSPERWRCLGMGGKRSPHPVLAATGVGTKTNASLHGTVGYYTRQESNQGCSNCKTHALNFNPHKSKTFRFDPYYQATETPPKKTFTFEIENSQFPYISIRTFISLSNPVLLNRRYGQLTIQ